MPRRPMSPCSALLLVWLYMPGPCVAQALPESIYDALESGRYEAALVELGEEASKGNVEAEYLLGTMYERGTGVHTDTLSARSHYSVAAKAGHSNAQYALARNFYLASKYDDAFVWATKAADQKNRSAAYLLSKLYQDGKGVSTDKQKAEYWRHFAFSGRE